MDLGEEYQKGNVPFSLNHVWRYMILMCFITSDTNLDYLAKVVSIRFLQSKVFFLSILRLRKWEISAVILQLSHGKLDEF